MVIKRRILMKTKKLWSAFMVVAFLGILNGCPAVLWNVIKGNGNIVSQERPASDFFGVILEGVGDVNIYHAENYRLVVTTDSNIQDIITTRVYGNNVYISKKVKNNSGFDPTKLIIDVYMPELKNVDLKGVGNIAIADGNVVAQNNVVVTLSGSGEIKIPDGKTSDFKIKLSGVGNIIAQNYEAENVVVDHSGSGDIKTWVTKSLTGKISGIGNVFYKGSPAINNVHITGSGGSVRKL
jgi:hypothetical protein